LRAKLALLGRNPVPVVEIEKADCRMRAKEAEYILASPPNAEVVGQMMGQQTDRAVSSNIAEPAVA
jgi:hypothetical protein